MKRNNIIQKLDQLRMFNMKMLLMKIGFSYSGSYQTYIVGGKRMNKGQRESVYDEIQSVIDELNGIIEKDIDEWGEDE